jgi:hypothetical protein
MATISYTFVDRCAGGGHTRLDVSFNGGAAQRLVYATDDIRQPLSALTQDEREQLALLILKVHMAGKTRTQIVSEFSSPVTVTI